MDIQIGDIVRETIRFKSIMVENTFLILDSFKNGMYLVYNIEQNMTSRIIFNERNALEILA